MINKYFFTAFLFASLNAAVCSAAFEYNGTFSANRKPGETQSYYILLNENTNVTFSIKSNGKDCKEVFVNSIKSSSDESISLSSKTGIVNYHIPATGIYEVSVTSSGPLNAAISYDLTVNESAASEKTVPQQSQNIQSVKQESKPAEIETKKNVDESTKLSINKESASSSGSFSLIGGARIIDDSEPELKNNPLNNPENNTVGSILPENKAEDIKENSIQTELSTDLPKQGETKAKDVKPNSEISLVPIISGDTAKTEPAAEKTEKSKEIEEPVTVVVAESLSPDAPAVENDDYSELDPDAPAVEDDEQEVSPTPQEPAKQISYKGTLKLSNTVDAYRFLGDKNKCWPKSICFDDKNNLWVLDGQLCHIICYSPKGTELLYFGKKGKAVNELGIPVSLAVYKDYVLVGDRQKNVFIFLIKKAIG